MSASPRLRISGRSTPHPNFESNFSTVSAGNGCHIEGTGKDRLSVRERKREMVQREKEKENERARKREIWTRWVPTLPRPRISFCSISPARAPAAAPAQSRILLELNTANSM